jgi:hypothetical protein
MPLFLSKTGTSPTVLTKDKDRIVSYTLTSDGLKQLRGAGVRSAQQVPPRILASLIKSGYAHSPRPAEASGQVRFDFESDDTSDYLPRCEMTGVASDVHLVVYGEGNGTVAKLLGSEPRFVLQKVTSLSMPVTVLSFATLGQLEATNKVPFGSAAAVALRTWLRHDFKTGWEKLLRDRELRQSDLPLEGPSDTLPLTD